MAERMVTVGERRELSSLPPEQQERVQAAVRAAGAVQLQHAVELLSGGAIRGEAAQALGYTLAAACEDVERGRDPLAGRRVVAAVAAQAELERLQRDLEALDARLQALGPGIRRLKAERDRLAAALEHQRGASDDLERARRRRRAIGL